MSKLSRQALFWIPRVLSMLFIVFVSMFALDVFNEGLGPGETIRALLVHLIPSFVLIAILIVAWRREWVGAAFFAAAGALYVVTLLPKPTPSPSIKLTWILTIAGPAFIIAALFLASWRISRRPTVTDRSVG